ncbi:MAG: hypothetical protein VXA34_00270 [Gammaproteobacteria bacterium]
MAIINLDEEQEAPSKVSANIINLDEEQEAPAQISTNVIQLDDIPLQPQEPGMGDAVKSYFEPQTEYEGVAQEFFEGIASGLIAIPQGILELGASAVDLAADTNYASSVTDAANKLRDAAGIDPEGLIGKGSEAIIQYVIPGLGAASAVSKLSKVGRLHKALQSGKGGLLGRTGAAAEKLTKGEKLALGAQQVAAAGAVDAVVATDGTTTIADFFEGGPTQTDQEVGLSGREEALRRLTNKLKIGLETGGLTIAAPLALSATGTVAGKVLTETPIISDAVSGAAAGTLKGARYIGRSLDTMEAKRVLGQEQSPIANLVADVSKTFRYRGYLPEEVAEARLLITGETDKLVKEARGVLAGIDKEMNKVLKEAARVSDEASPLTKQSMFTNIEEFMTAPTEAARNRALAELPTNVAEKAKEMRGMVKRLNRDILNSDFLTRLRETNARQAARITNDIEKNLNTYLRRRYQSFEVENYTPSSEVMERAIVGFQSSPKAVVEELEKIITAASPEDKVALLREYGVREIPSTDLEKASEFELVNRNVTRAQAEVAAKHFLESNSRRGAKTQKAFYQIADYKINPKLFVSRVEMPKYKRELLGEITDPKESFLGTVSDLAEFKAIDDYFGKVRRLATQTDEAGNLTNPGVANLFRDTSTMSAGELRALKEEGYQVLDDNKAFLEGQYGSLRGMAVPAKVANELQRYVIGDTNVLGTAIRNTYSGFLRLKGATQFGKTVLSPVTQIRNVTTASLFALAQGNIGRGANLGESARIVLNNLFTDVPSDQALKSFQEMQQLGLIGTQAQLRELQELISKGLGYGVDEINGIPVGRKFGNKFTDTKLGSMLGNVGKKAENLYQAGDDVWKIYNFQFEFNKLKNAYRGMSDEAIIADLSARRGLDTAGKTAERLLKEEAAYIVRNTVPNYNMAPEIIKTLRRAPVGNFIAFPYEIIRTGANTIARGIDELASTNAEIRKIGLRRLTGAITTFGVMPAAMAEMAYTMSGVSEEEMKAYQRSVAPPWERNALLLPTGRDKETGLPVYVNYSYSNPYDMLEKVATAALNASEEGQRLGKNGAQITFSAANAALRELFAPFTEEAIITAKIRDVLDPESETIGIRQAAQFVGGRGGRTVTGAKVYNEQDSAGDKLAKSFAHIADALIPGAVPIDVRSGEFEASRFARGFVGGLGLEETLGISSKDRMLRERELSKELSRAFSGVTENPVESTGLKFKGYEFARARQDAANIFVGISNRGNATSEDFISAYRRANEAQFRVQSEMYNIIEDMRTMGMNDKQIRKVFKEAGIGGYQKLMRGKFDPIDISPTVRKNVRRNELNLPRREINEIRRELRNLPLGTAKPPVKKQEAPTLDLGSLPEQSAAALPSSTVPAQAGAVPAPQSAPAPSSQPQDAAGILPLLGSGLDALKNLQIFQRTQ